MSRCAQLCAFVDDDPPNDCSDTKFNAASLWLFMPSKQIQVMRLAQKSVTHEITNDGSLQMKSVDENGTLYCYHNGTMLHTYSVTVTKRLKRGLFNQDIDLSSRTISVGSD